LLAWPLNFFLFFFFCFFSSLFSQPEISTSNANNRAAVGLSRVWLDHNFNDFAISLLLFQPGLSIVEKLGDYLLGEHLLVLPA
jgi:hypothetical protein